MRFIIKEQDYEKPIAAGRLRFERNGIPIGAYENWRITELAGGYRFLRVDLDSREAASGESTLYHLVLTQEGVSERLKFWHFGQHGEIRGDLLVEDGTVVLSRILNEDRRENVIEMVMPFVFWFPSTMGLSLLLQRNNNDSLIETVTLDRDSSFKLLRRQVKVNYYGKEDIVVAGQQLPGQRYSINWDDQHREVWLDRHLLPVKIQRNHDLVGNAIQHLRYLHA